MLAYILALFTGLSLGMLGGGGSILTVPILVYAVGMDPKLSIALSLAIVGATSLVGVYAHYKNKNINLKVAGVFAPAAMLGTFAGSKLSALFSAQAQLILFASIMILASYFMFKPARPKEGDGKIHILPMVAQGIVVGILTGLVGVGGGFLIVPGLVLMAGLPMKQAVGTSLLVIALNSMSGFAGYVTMFDIPWSFLGIFTAFSIVGIIIGTKLSKKVSQEQLKKGFAVFLILMGIFILYKNKETLIQMVSFSVESGIFLIEPVHSLMIAA